MIMQADRQLSGAVAADRTEHLRNILEECGAILHGHFRLASDRHSEVYIEKFRILERPKVLAEVAEEIVKHFRHSGATVVAGPSTGGMLVALEVARQLDLTAVYVEHEPGTKTRTLRRGGEIPADAKVLLVDDVFTTGVSLMDVLPVVRQSGAELVGVGVLIDRSERLVDFGAPFFASIRFPAVTFDEKDLPAWLAEIPLTVRGTRAAQLPSAK